MTNAELIKKIKVEIERRIEEYNIQSRAGAELADLLSFIESLEKEQPQGLDEAPKKRLRKICNLREDLKDEPIEEKLQELREIRAEKDRLDEAAKQYADGPEATWHSVTALEFAFKAGAEWMAGQGVVADFEVNKFAVCVWLAAVDEDKFQKDIYDNFEVGDKVIVQIRKKLV